LPNPLLLLYSLKFPDKILHYNTDRDNLFCDIWLLRAG
jgi:hypothetical protein